MPAEGECVFSCLQHQSTFWCVFKYEGCTCVGIHKSGVYLYHRSIEWLELGGTPRIIKSHPLCHRQGHQPPDLALAQVRLPRASSNLALNMLCLLL